MFAQADEAARGGTVTAHRFRHTVGTQLVEHGAKLHTIMKVLGHSSVSMALVYAQISDQEVLRDYKMVLAPGATIASPAADELKSGSLPAEAVDWLKTNFFKTELELGHCLRLPQEGPCECDLYLTCVKFVTTPAYAPRLRARRRVEQALATDAASLRGCPGVADPAHRRPDRPDQLAAALDSANVSVATRSCSKVVEGLESWFASVSVSSHTCRPMPNPKTVARGSTAPAGIDQAMPITRLMAIASGQHC